MMITATLPPLVVAVVYLFACLPPLSVSFCYKPVFNESPTHSLNQYLDFKRGYNVQFRIFLRTMAESVLLVTHHSEITTVSALQDYMHWRMDQFRHTMWCSITLVHRPKLLGFSNKITPRVIRSQVLGILFKKNLKNYDTMIICLHVLKLTCLIFHHNFLVIIIG